MTYRNAQSLVSTEWLAAHKDDPGLVLLDGRFNLPGSPTTGPQDYAAAHIPGAILFDIDAVADHSTSLPHMLPSPEQFAEQVGAMGISNDSFIVAYDGPGLWSVGRTWWMFRAMGHDKIAVLDGGLKKWMEEGRPVTREVPVPRPARFTARLRPELVRSKSEVMGNLSSRASQVVDARAARRFQALDPEPRPGLRGGHIPGSLNVPVSMLSNADGTVRSEAEIRTAFHGAGFDFAKPVITSCGSGSTAAALAFALHLAGKEDVAVYDGSWAEWGIPGDNPVEV
jgi:thiosulfate/3-mercaptopyruvate sulfurtransferase